MYPFKEDSFAPRNAWWCAGFAEELGRELTSRTILNKPVVMYRRESGEAVAVGGRCPHRHFPLGQSCLKGDEVVCGYHGISFGPDGKCTNIPSQRHAPLTYRIPVYPLVEHGLWLWIWMGDPDQADPSLLPNLEEIMCGVEGCISKPFYFFEVKARYQLLNDNLCDLTHIAFLHGDNAGVAEHASTPEQHEKAPGFISSRRYMPATPVSSLMRKMGIEADHVDRVSGMDFYLPGFHAGIGDVNYPNDHPTRPGERIFGGRVYHAITPSTYCTTYYWFALTGISEEHVEGARGLLRNTLDQDVFAAEEIEKQLKLAGEDLEELMIRSDRGAVEARRMLQAMMDSERTDAA